MIAKISGFVSSVAHVEDLFRHSLFRPIFLSDDSRLKEYLILSLCLQFFSKMIFLAFDVDPARLSVMWKEKKRLAVAFLSLTQKWQFWGKKCWLNDFKVVLKRTWVPRQIKLEEPALVRLNSRDIILKRTYLGWVVFVSWRQLGPSNLSAEVLILMIS